MYGVHVICTILFFYEWIDEEFILLPFVNLTKSNTNLICTSAVIIRVHFLCRKKDFLLSPTIGFFWSFLHRSLQNMGKFQSTFYFLEFSKKYFLHFFNQKYDKLASGSLILGPRGYFEQIFESNFFFDRDLNMCMHYL